MKTFTEEKYEMELKVYDGSSLAANFLKDHTSFTDLNSKIISSLFLVCSPTNNDKSFLLVLKPESLILKKVTVGQGVVKDVFHKVDDQIAPYVLYRKDDIITGEILQSNTTPLSIFQKIIPEATTVNTPSFPTLLTDFPKVFIRDKNLANKSRFATSNNNPDLVNFILPTWL